MGQIRTEWDKFGTKNKKNGTNNGTNFKIICKSMLIIALSTFKIIAAISVAMSAKMIRKMILKVPRFIHPLMVAVWPTWRPNLASLCTIYPATFEIVNKGYNSKGSEVTAASQGD